MLIGNIQNIVNKAVSLILVNLGDHILCQIYLEDIYILL